MKVKELIMILQDQDPEAIVYETNQFQDIKVHARHLGHSSEEIQKMVDGIEIKEFEKDKNEYKLMLKIDHPINYVFKAPNKIFLATHGIVTNSKSPITISYQQKRYVDGGGEANYKEVDLEDVMHNYKYNIETTEFERR